MNREIKFRAWDEDRKTMVFDFNAVGHPEYSLLQTEEQAMLCGNTKDNGDWQEPVLMQFTGIKDKNGKEIYEGDVVRGALISELTDEGLPIMGAVAYSNDFAHFGIKNDAGITHFSKCPRHLLEVVGNIYQNPELTPAS